MPMEAGKRDVITHYAFDTQTIAAAVPATAPVLTFFQQTRSAGLHLTNMKVAGMFPHPEKFIVRSVRLVVPLCSAVAGTATLAADAAAVFFQGYMTLNAGSKDYIDAWPLELFNAGFSQQTNERADATASVSYHGSGQPDSVLTLAHPIVLNSNEPFRLTLAWNAWPDPTVALGIKVVLGGQLIRSVQ